jgi:hypothetical protein
MLMVKEDLVISLIQGHIFEGWIPLWQVLLESFFDW